MLESPRIFISKNVISKVNRSRSESTEYTHFSYLFNYFSGILYR